MGIILTVKGAEYEVIPDGSYHATLKEIEGQHDEVNHRDYLLWRFEARGKSGKTAEVVGFSSYYFSPKAKAYGWARALLGRELVKGEDIDLETLIGRPCQLVVKRERRDDGSERNVIVDVLGAAAAEEDLPF